MQVFKPCHSCECIVFNCCDGVVIDIQFGTFSEMWKCSSSQLSNFIFFQINFDGFRWNIRRNFIQSGISSVEDSCHVLISGGNTFSQCNWKEIINISLLIVINHNPFKYDQKSKRNIIIFGYWNISRNNRQFWPATGLEFNCNHEATLVQGARSLIPSIKVTFGDNC